MKRLISIILAMRLKTLSAAVVPVWAGCVLSSLNGHELNIRLAIATLIGALSIQIATNFFNDVIDARKGADTDRRLGPVRVTASGLIPPRIVVSLGLISLCIAVVCGWVLYQDRGWPILCIGVPSIFLAYGYTGGPFPLAYRGMGECFVLLFFGWVAVLGTVYIQAGVWTSEALLLGTQIGLLSSVLISINNFRDREEDEATGKRTLAVRFGPKFAAALIWIEIKSAVFLGLFWIGFGKPEMMLASAVPAVLGSRIIWGVITEPPSKRFNHLLALSGIQLVLFGSVIQLIFNFS